MTTLTRIFALSLGCLAVGCAPSVATSSDDSGATAAVTLAPDGSMYEGRAQLGSRGIQVAKWDTKYADTNAYELPDEGIDLQSAFIAGDVDLGIPDGYYTELSVYRLHKTADQVGVLQITGASGAAIRMARRDAGSSTVTSTYLNDRPYDYGSVYNEAYYTIMVGPGGTPSGDETYSFKGLRFHLLTPGE